MQTLSIYRFARLLSLAVAGLGMTQAANAAVVISSIDTPVILDFETTQEGVSNIGTGSGADHGIGSVVSSENYNARGPHNDNKNAALHCESNLISSSNPYWNDDAKRSLAFGPHPIKGARNSIKGPNKLGIRTPEKIPGHGSHAVAFAENNDRSKTAYYLLIQNNTGQTITNWTFACDFAYQEPDAKGFSKLEFGYATGGAGTDTVDPETLSFTSFGAAPPVTQGATYATLAGRLHESVATQGVAHGDYIVLAFKDTSTKSGSDIIVDNISITALVSGEWVDRSDAPISTPPVKPVTAEPAPEPIDPGGFVEPE